MNKSRAYDIVNGIGGICATDKEAKEALTVLEALSKVNNKQELLQDLENFGRR